MHVKNCIYIKFETGDQFNGYTSLHKRQNDAYQSVESTILQASNRRLEKGRIDGCTSVDSTVTIAELTVILIILKNIIKIFMTLQCHSTTWCLP